MGNGNGKKVQQESPQRSAPQGGAGGGTQVMQAAAHMKNTIGNLEKRRKLLELRVKKTRSEALQLKKAGNQAQALMAMKRVRLYQEALGRVDGQMFNLEKQQINLESGSITQDVVGAMQTGVAAQQRMNNRINVETVENLMEKNQEFDENLRELNEVLAEDSVGVDDDALMAELNQMENEYAEKEEFAEQPKETEALPDAPTAKPEMLPSVPKKVPVVAKPKAVLAGDDAAFAQLEADLL